MTSKKILIHAVIFISLCVALGVWVSLDAMKNKPSKECVAVANLGFNWYMNGNDPKFIENEDMKFGYFCAKFPKVGGATCIDDYCVKRVPQSR